MIAPLAAIGRSASANTMFGLFPPSSSETRFTVSAPMAAMRFPTAVEPVNAILSTPGWATSAAPVVAPGPGTTLRTPGGRPTSDATSASRSAVSGVSEAGLSTTVHPAASAGATFQEARFRGKFQGTMAPTTPTGSRSV